MAVFTTLGDDLATLRDPMFTGGIVLGSLNRSDFALTGNTTLELRAYFVSGAILHRVGAAAHQHHQCEQ